MRAISLWQPWATGIVVGSKRIVASLLDLPREQVPHFLAGLSENNSLEFERRLNRFLAGHGLVHVELEITAAESWFRRLKYRAAMDCYHMIYGLTPRGFMHAVVGLNGEVNHDPHPTRAGLLDDRSKWTYAFLVRACRSKPDTPL